MLYHLIFFSFFQKNLPFEYLETELLLPEHNTILKSRNDSVTPHTLSFVRISQKIILYLLQIVKTVVVIHGGDVENYGY